jgi:hypothetical protein
MTYRSGDIVVPRIDAGEPLGLELADFAHSIRTGEEPRSNSRLGLEIVRALEAAHASMERAGDPVELEEGEHATYGERTSESVSGLEGMHPPSRVPGGSRARFRRDMGVPSGLSS